MNRTVLLGSSGLRSAAFVACAFAGLAPAYAQQPGAPAAAPTPVPETDQITTADTAPAAAEATLVVTGTRIRRPNEVSAVPVTSIGGEEILQTGNVALGDLLNELPALRTTFSQANSTRFIGTAGVNFLDLRGLGTQSTLVLQNGRRHVSASPGIFRVDVNTIPMDLVERVDIITGGASAVYGSDAVAGVVNFVLKRNFEGIQARGQAGISARGDRPTYAAALTAGRNFAEGRGNIAASVEYNRSEALYTTDRPGQSGAFAGRTQFQIVEDIANEPGGSDGTPDRRLLTNVRSLGLSEGGTFVASRGTASVIGACATPQACINGFPRVFRFQPDGTLVEADYGLDLRPQTAGATGNQVGGDGSTLRRYGQLAPFVERYSANLIGHFDIAEALTPFFEAKYVRYNIFQQSSPTFQSGGTQTGTLAQQTGFPSNSAGVPISFDNAFLNPQAAATIRSLLPEGQTAFRLQRNNLDFGNREESGHRETYRAVVGLRGTFNTDWTYEVAANYGRFEQDMLSRNNRIQQRFRLAADAVRDPASGRIVCRSQLAGVTTPTPTNPADAAALAGDIAACVPINLFGEGAPSPEALAYVNADTTSIQRHEQKVVSAHVAGDLSQLFELPGGPVGFAIGGEWRQEDGFRDFGDLVVQNRTFLTAISRFRPPEKFEVKEAFAEVNVPLLAAMPVAHELSLQGAARVADYRGNVGTVLAWNAGATWAPIRDVRLRGNYAVAVRAPTQFDLYAELGQNFGQLSDPCDVNFINNGSPTRVANCRAAGIGEGFVNAPARASSTAFATGGNPFLQEETSRSITIGAVVQPRFVPGLSLTADYYDIRITNVIGAPSAQQILNNCYDSATLQNPFCAVIRRDPATNFFSVAAPEFGLIQGGVNFAKATARGVDFEAAYRRNLGFGMLNLRANGTYVLERNDYPFITEPDRPDQLLLEVGDPRFQLNLAANLRTGPVTFGYQMRYVSKQAVTAIEDIRSVGGNPPQNADWADVEFLPAVHYHDFRLGFQAGRNMDFYVGVDNAFDRLPPAGILGNGSTYGAESIFDNIGRFFYAGAVVRF
jgi:outer membrane receptor protein involved in Fe transport